MKSLDPKTLEFLADLICGDHEGFQYRKGWELAVFFRNAGLLCSDHDGSTRKWWALERLKQYNRVPEAMEKIIVRLANPKEYDDQSKLSTVLDKLNERLALEGYEVVLEDVQPVLKSRVPKVAVPSKDTILRYPMPDFSGLVFDDPELAELLRNCWDEAKKCLEAGAYLLGIVGLGSLLEGLLLAKVRSWSEDVFRLPILETLVELGGSAAIGEVLDRVYEKMKQQLNKYDLQPLPSSSDQPRYRNTAQWC